MLAGALAVLSGCSTKPVSTLPEPQASSTAWAVGNHCNFWSDLIRSGRPNPEGLQCYVATSIDLETDGSGDGIWIKPNMTLSNQYLHTTAEYNLLLKPWKKYVSPDKTISFYYPQNYRVVASSGNDSPTGTAPFDAFTIQGLEPADQHADGPDLDYYLATIIKYSNNNLSMEEDIKNEEMNKSFQAFNVEINGSKGTRLNIAPENNLSGRREYSELFFQKDQYRVTVKADITEDPFYAFPAEYLLSTIKLK
ncbi:MAG TPA: hypothetical protein VMD74_00285 [Candidatus Methylomirabilis sp.]|nr:hypothetical protein [Candidatus Methylomirabilis sp.]